jgi:hypothetical protein
VKFASFGRYPLQDASLVCVVDERERLLMKMYRLLPFEFRNKKAVIEPLLPNPLIKEC